MEIGVNFPQAAFRDDPLAIRDFVQAVEGLEFTHLMAGDHVLGEDPRRYSGRPGPYSAEFPYHEPFLLLSYLAAVTSKLRFITGVVILPQRQTVLVAKQAAELDFLSNGRLTLGLGIGWNELEYRALREDFHNRGERSEEQLAVMRMLWTQDVVEFHGRWHDIEPSGINPRPIQQPIPILIGGIADSVLLRTAALADGWIPTTPPGQILTPDAIRGSWDQLRKYVTAANREQSAVGLHGRMEITNEGVDGWMGDVEEWRALGAKSLSVGTRTIDASPEVHLRLLEQFQSLVRAS